MLVDIQKPEMLENMTRFFSKTNEEVIMMALCLLNASTMVIEVREDALEKEINEGFEGLGIS